MERDSERSGSVCDAWLGKGLDLLGPTRSKYQEGAYDMVHCKML